MNPYRYAISLRVRHPKMDPAEISSALQLAPEWSWKAGDPRMNPVGTRLKGNWRDTYWTRTVLKGESSGKDLAGAIAELAFKFALRKPFFQKVRSGGGQVEFFVGWFMDSNSGDDFSPDLMGRLADLGIGLSLDVYPPDTNTDVIPGERRIDDAS